MMKLIIGTSCVVVLAIGASGCGDSGSTAAKKNIERVEVAESPFKPVALEASIDSLVEALAETDAQTFPVTVITKPFGGYWEPVKVGANRAMAELDLTGQVEAPVDNADPDITAERQVEILTDRVDQEYGGIGIAPMRATVNEQIDRAVDAGTPVVTIDSDAADSKRQLYIGTNNAEAGKTGGATLAGLITEETGTVFILGYDAPDWPDGFARSQGAKEVLEAAGYTVVLHRVGWSDEEVADDFAVLPDQVLNADPPTVGMIGMFSNAYRNAEIAEQVGFAAGEVKIVAFDFEPDTLKYIDNGYIQATHVQRQYYMGYLLPYALYAIKTIGLDATVDALADQMIDGHRFDSGVDVVAADRVGEYNSFLDSLGIGG